MAAPSLGAKIANFKSTVEKTKGNTEELHLNQKARYQKMAQRAEVATDDGEKGTAWAGFFQHENKAVAARVKSWSTKDFEPLAVLGEGSFGKVQLVQQKGTENFFALKQMVKKRYRHKNQRRQVFAERDVMTVAKNRWYVELLATFQDTDHVYMVMEFVQGGDFLYHLCVYDRLSAANTAFYMAELLEALDLLHRNDLVHRDVKPDNMVLDKTGHLKLLDFGLCKDTSEVNAPVQPQNAGVILKPAAPEASVQKAGGLPMLPMGALKRSDDAKGHQRLKTQVGTYEYMAPEVLNAEYGKEVDIWAVGVITFECIAGFNMFHSGNETPEQVQGGVRRHKELLEHWITKIKEKNKNGQTKRDLTKAAEDLVRGLICVVTSRLTVEQCRKHAFFMKIDFGTLREQTPPIVPEIRGPDDTHYFDAKPPVPLPEPQVEQLKDARLEWSHYEYDREAKDLQRKDVDVDKFFGKSS
mmetsp:Transcript_17314/g.40314  ORF Transcript_17314/g.40314 Transcript_17314/m.40314 type:complete len:469 (+) Transcript_17314:95-1501(+)